ncbi:hypothetical protein G7046_g9916 [Stylonectria norvegica]|nr:hypothetical protein G7046_g9916 [Stylonectria norvegica]
MAQQASLKLEMRPIEPFDFSSMLDEWRCGLDELSSTVAERRLAGVLGPSAQRRWRPAPTASAASGHRAGSDIENRIRRRHVEGRGTSSDTTHGWQWDRSRHSKSVHVPLQAWRVMKKQQVILVARAGLTVVLLISSAGQQKGRKKWTN